MTFHSTQRPSQDTGIPRGGGVVTSRDVCVPRRSLGVPSLGILSLSRPKGQGRVLRLVGESEYPGLFRASSDTRFEVEVEFEVLIQVEP